MGIYNQADKDNQRETWAGFNMIAVVIVLIVAVCTLLYTIWDGDRETVFFWWKIVITMFILLVLSVVLYCVKYVRFVE